MGLLHYYRIYLSCCLWSLYLVIGPTPKYGKKSCVSILQFTRNNKNKKNKSSKYFKWNYKCSNRPIMGQQLLSTRKIIGSTCSADQSIAITALNNARHSWWSQFARNVLAMCSPRMIIFIWGKMFAGISFYFKTREITSQYQWQATPTPKEKINLTPIRPLKKRRQGRDSVRCW